MILNLLHATNICVIENPRFINNIMLILMVGELSLTDSYKTSDLNPGVILTEFLIFRRFSGS